MSDTCSMLHTITVRDAKGDAVQVHRFTGKKHIQLHCQGTYVDDLGEVFDTTKHTLTYSAADNGLNGSRHLDAIVGDTYKCDQVPGCRGLTCGHCMKLYWGPTGTGDCAAVEGCSDGKHALNCLDCFVKMFNSAEPGRCPVGCKEWNKQGIHYTGIETLFTFNHTDGPGGYWAGAEGPLVLQSKTDSNYLGQDAILTVVKVNSDGRIVDYKVKAPGNGFKQYQKVEFAHPGKPELDKKYGIWGATTGALASVNTTTAESPPGLANAPFDVGDNPKSSVPLKSNVRDVGDYTCVPLCVPDQ